MPYSNVVNVTTADNLIQLLQLVSWKYSFRTNFPKLFI